MEKPHPSARDVSPMLGPGVYLLYLDETLQWVGSSKLLAKRIAEHQAQGFLFDRVYIIPCEAEGLPFLERGLIQRLRPQLNTRHTVGEDVTFAKGPLAGFTLKAKKPEAPHDYRSGTDLDGYLEEIAGKLT